MGSQSETATVEVILEGQKTGKSIKELDATMRSLNAEIRKLKPGTEEFAATAKKLDAVKETLKKTKEEAFNVGGAFKKFTSQASELPVVGKGIDGIGKAFKLATGPIGLILMGIGLLISIFKQFTPLVDRLKEVFAGVMGVINEVTKRIILLGQGLADIVNGDVEKGMQKISDSTANLGESLKDAYINAAELEKRLMDLADAKRADAVLDSDTEAQILRLIAQSKNRALGIKAQMDLLKQARKLEEDKLAGDKELIDREIKIEMDRVKTLGFLSEQEINAFIKGELTRDQIASRRGKIADDDFDKLADLQVKKNNLIGESEALQERLNSREETLGQKQDERNKKAIEARQKIVDANRKMLQEIDQLHSASLKNEQEREEEALLNALIAKKAEVKNGVENQANKNAMLLALDQKYVFDLDAIKTKAREKMTEEEKKAADKKEKDDAAALAKVNRGLLAEKELAVLITKAGTPERLAAEEAYLKLRMEQEVANVELTEGEKALVRQRYEEDKKKLDEEQDKKTLDRAASVTSQLQGIYSSASNSLLKIMENRDQAELQANAAKRDQEKANLDNQLQSGVISKEKYDKKVSALNETFEKRRADMQRQAFIRGKIAAIIQSGIDTTQATIKALGTPPVPNIVLAGVTAGLGALAIAAIASTPVPQYGRGGSYLSQGRTHANGGMPIINPITGMPVAEIEVGETILSRRTTASNWPLIQALLSSGGAPINPWHSTVPASVNYSGMTSTARRYAEGGQFAPPTSTVNQTSPAATADMKQLASNQAALTNAILMLVNRLDLPIEARYDDGEIRTITGRQEQFATLKDNARV